MGRGGSTKNHEKDDKSTGYRPRATDPSSYGYTTVQNKEIKSRFSLDEE